MLVSYIGHRSTLRFFDMLEKQLIEDRRIKLHQPNINERTTNSNFLIYVISPTFCDYSIIAKLSIAAVINSTKVLFSIITQEDQYEFDDCSKEAMEEIKTLACAYGAKHFNTIEEMGKYILDTTNRVYHT